MIKVFQRSRHIPTHGNQTSLSTGGTSPPALGLRGRSLRVGVVGGGPAGSFCAIGLCRLSQRFRLDLEVTVFDYKNFEKLGPAGCNMCAGVIPDSLVRNLRALDIDLPEHVIQRRLEGYLLHTRGGAVDIPTPPATTIYATFRGPGPLGMYPAAREGFDWWLLSEAQRAGASHVSKLVTDVRPPQSQDEPFAVISRDGFSYEADLLVGAFGVNSNLVSVFEQLGQGGPAGESSSSLGYRAPRTVRARQAEIPLDPEFIQAQLRNRVLIFATGRPGLRFAAVTPKRQHVTVTLIGDSPDKAMLEEFLQSRELRAHFPPGWEMPDRYCSCAPRMPVSPAHNPVGDRLLMIGDTNIARYLKNGIESSFHTAMWAAQAICAELGCDVDGGVTAPSSRPPFSREALRRRYVFVCHRAYLSDNHYGRLLFRLHDFISRSSIMARAHLQIAQQEQRSPGPSKPLSEVLWGLFTGSVPYRTILLEVLNPALQLRLLTATLAAMICSFPLPRFACCRRSRPAIGRTTVVRRRRVLIIGAGPAGASCAIALARASAAPEVVLIEGKQFGEHQNQDAGVLSPPGPELLRQVLGEDPAPGLFQRRIEGYVLHGREREIRLDGNELGEISLALRRVELDSLLLERARASGAEVVKARATAVEVDRNGVVVYTEGSSFRGDALIGAFALDEGMARALAHRTRYRPPASLETLACKIHPAGLDFIPGLLEDCIHVFLPRQPGIEFGALIPKGNHITVVVAGARLNARDMGRFLAQEQVAQHIAVGSRVSGYYKGAFPLGPARGLCGDRHVMIGDAAGLVRPFKGKGINCALESGLRCAQAILAGGFSRQALCQVERSQRSLTRDVWFGRLVRLLVWLVGKLDLLDPIIAHARRSPELRQVLFDCVSGRTTYREVVLRRANLKWLPEAIWRLAMYRLVPRRWRA